MKPYILDHDGSGDDYIALMLLNSQKLAIKGITIAATGESLGEKGADNTAAFCYYLGLDEVPIAYGTKTPLSTKYHLPFPDFILDYTTNKLMQDKPLKPHPRPNITPDAVELMRKVMSESAQRVTIVATGPLTNIADFIGKYPQLAADKIEKIVIMGGAVNTHGNIKGLHFTSTNEDGECNIIADPEAAKQVFASNLPIVLVPLDATNQVPLTEEYYHSLALSPNADHQLVYLLLQDIYKLVGHDAFFKTYYLWDPLATMIGMDLSLATYESMALTVDLQTGKTKWDQIRGNAHQTRVAMNIKEPKTILAKLMDMIGSRLSQDHQDVLVANPVYTPARVQSISVGADANAPAAVTQPSLPTRDLKTHPFMTPSYK